MNSHGSIDEGMRTGRRVRFRNRQEAGQRLAEPLASYAKKTDVLILGLPRGGVPVAYEVALGLRAPLDVLIIRKLGVPSQPELAMGAIASGGVRVLNPEIVRYMSDAEWVVERVAAAEQRELERREKEYRGDHAPAEVTGKVVIVVDDGLATGASMRAAVLALRERKAARVVVAVPVGSREACAKLGMQADELVCLSTPVDFSAVGQAYEDFSQTTDEEVCTLLAEARKHAN
jgi:putative phosphoribosyl transferase